MGEPLHGMIGKSDTHPFLEKVQLSSIQSSHSLVSSTFFDTWDVWIYPFGIHYVTIQYITTHVLAVNVTVWCQTYRQLCSYTANLHHLCHLFIHCLLILKLYINTKMFNFCILMHMKQIYNLIYFAALGCFAYLTGIYKFKRWPSSVMKLWRCRLIISTLWSTS